MIDMTLPIPPSANALWRGAGSRVVKSAKYKAWVSAAGLLVRRKYTEEKFTTIEDEYMLQLFLPRTMRGDIDNRHKAINDLMQRMGIVANDKNCECLIVMYGEKIKKDQCRVIVTNEPYSIIVKPKSQQEKSDV